MKKYTKKEYVEAYTWMYGGTKKAAMESYDMAKKDGDHSMIKVIIDGYRDQCKKAFYND